MNTSALRSRLTRTVPLPSRRFSCEALAIGRHFQQSRPAPITQRLLHNSAINKDAEKKIGASEQSFEETAKRQWRSYHKWRQHFTWRRESIMQFLRDYSVWTLLALLAYYNLEKRQELQAYEADAFVILDDLESRIQKLDPNNRLLVGTYHEAKDTAVVSDTGSDATSSSSSSSSSDEQPKSPSSTPPPSNGSGGAVFF